MSALLDRYRFEKIRYENIYKRMQYLESENDKLRKQIEYLLTKIPEKEALLLIDVLETKM